MVQIISYKERQTEDGKSFFVLELQGGLEMVRSQETNQFYATAKKAFISSTFDEATCNSLIGTSMSLYSIEYLDRQDFLFLQL